MSFVTAGKQIEDTSRLLNRLLECVQECQKRFGGKTELATEFDRCVQYLCYSLEAVFIHGLRNKPLDEPVSTLKQVSDIVTNSLHLNNEAPSFWNFVKRHLTKHEQERYDLLKHIWTDTGKCKAWIRAALNERSLEKYFVKVLSNKNTLRIYYEDWAFLCDDEKNSLLPNMAAGLASILFAISIDKPELNSSSYNSKIEKPKIEPIIEAPLIEKPQRESKKKRRVVKQFISFDNDDEISSSSIPSSLGSEISNSDNKLEVKSQLKPRIMEEESGSSDTQSNNSETLKTSDPQTPLERKLSFENSGSRERYPKKLDGPLTPLQPNIGELTPISVESSSEPEEGLEVPSDVSAVLTVVETKNKEEISKLQDKIALLSKENENLKEQLKTYMDAVQLLKDDNPGQQDPAVPDYRGEAKLFEQKLVQVAEMHAELMDFNVALQQNLCLKDSQIERLRSELEELRGPMADHDLLDDARSCVNVWIPSAFLTGSGSEAHHVYQIFLRAGSDEWNIYRRYAQFHALHSDLKKLDRSISSFDFPPKKSLRNKDSSLVEDRRKRLQIYLRRILLHWPELSQCNSRFLLEQHLAFFKEEKDSKKDNRRSIFYSRRSGGTSNENHYTGL